MITNIDVYNGIIEYDDVTIKWIQINQFAKWWKDYASWLISTFLLIRYNSWYV